MPINIKVQSSNPAGRVSDV